MSRRAAWTMRVFLLVAALGAAPQAAFAADGTNQGAAANLSQGVGNLLLSAFELPAGILSGTVKGPLVLGTIQGTFVGAGQTVQRLVTGTGQLLQGTFQTVALLAPLAKYAFFFL